MFYGKFTISTPTWVDFNTFTGIPVGTAITLQNISTSFFYLGEGDSVPTDGILIRRGAASGDDLATIPTNFKRVWIKILDAPVTFNVFDGMSVGGALPPSVFSRGGRLSTESLSAAKQIILDGLGWYFEWVNPTIPAGGKVFCEVTVPPDYYMLLESREIITDRERVFYRLYPSDAYTNFTPTSGVSARNLRNDATLVFPNIGRLTSTVPNISGAAILNVPVLVMLQQEIVHLET